MSHVILLCAILINDRSEDTSSIASTVGISDGGSQGSNGNSRLGQLDNFLHNLRADKDSMEIFPINKIVTITDLLLIDCCGHCSVHPTLMHTWGDCVHNPEINLPVVDILMETVIIIDWGREYIIPTENGEGGGVERGYHTPQIATPFPTLYIQHAPFNNVLFDDLSKVTNTDIFSVIPNIAYVIQ